MMLKIKQSEVIISEIHNQPILWNKHDKIYKDKNLTSVAWSKADKNIGINSKKTIF